MKRIFLVFLLLAAVYVAYSRLDGNADDAMLSVAADQAVSASFQPVFTDYDAAYAQTYIRGWSVIVNRQLLETPDQAVGQMALTLLDRKLADIERTVYPYPLNSLKRVPIWIENGSTGLHGLAYHWSDVWLREHGYNPDKAKAVEIHNVRDFIDWEPTQPWFVLHELAHAYHDQALSENHEGITQAYENAVRLGLYDSVKYRDGNLMQAYARSNRMEYFAELSEAYFGQNDFYPFNREDLRQHDPMGYALMEKVWR